MQICQNLSVWDRNCKSKQDENSLAAPVKRTSAITTGFELCIRKKQVIITLEIEICEDMEMEYRKLSVDEAEQFWSLMNQLDYETKYMLYEPGERTKNLPRIESLIRDSVERQDFLLVAETDNKLIGYISAQKGRLNRIAHSAYIVVGILTDYRGKGIGTEFFKRLNIWAEENKVVRLELTVICENEAAKHLYINSGFEIEGIKRKSVCVDGKYLDEYYMARVR